MDKGTCSVDGCDRPTRHLIYCNAHYIRYRKHGHPQADKPVGNRRPNSVTIEQQVLANTLRVGDCLIWQGAENANGYGITSENHYGTRLAHRVAYMSQVGPIADGLVINHLCRNGLCVDVTHMEVVTQGENAIHGGGIQAAAELRRTRDMCLNGLHPWNEWTIKVYPNGTRYCLPCKQANELRNRKPYQPIGRAS